MSYYLLKRGRATTPPGPAPDDPFAIGIIVEHDPLFEASAGAGAGSAGEDADIIGIEVLIIAEGGRLTTDVAVDGTPPGDIDIPAEIPPDVDIPGGGGDQDADAELPPDEEA